MKRSGDKREIGVLGTRYLDLWARLVVIARTELICGMLGTFFVRAILNYTQYLRWRRIHEGRARVNMGGSRRAKRYIGVRALFAGYCAIVSAGAGRVILGSGSTGVDYCDILRYQR